MNVRILIELFTVLYWSEFTIYIIYFTSHSTHYKNTRLLLSWQS